MKVLKFSVIPSFILLLLVSLFSFCCQASYSASTPKPELKTLPMSEEKSISTYVPSEAAPNGGLAVTISYPTMSRYKEEGSPIVVLVPGYEKASGLRFTMNAPQVGFIEVRFAFPGGGLKKFHSGGSFDNRGENSQKALRDVILFAKGLRKDYKGRSLDKLTPRHVDYNNIGLVGWHDGINVILVTLANYHENLSFVNWIASYESPISSLLLPSNLGTTKELNLNKHYRQGSAATGKCVVDFKRLSYDPNRFRERTKRKKRNLATPKGVLFFDDNKNGKFDELTEFPLNYSIKPGVSKQFYCPEITNALKVSGMFKRKINLLNISEQEFEDLKKSNPEIVTLLGSTKKPKRKVEVTKPPRKLKFISRREEPVKPKRPKKNYTYILEVWPKTIATLKESENFYSKRDGALYIEKVAKLYPKLLVTVFGSKIDHFEQQQDHPHIALHYNLWLASKVNWVRLNPAKVYVGFTSDMNPDNFVNNKANEPIEASNIKDFLEPEGFISDSMYMRAAISELADRVRNNDFSCPLEGVLENYLNEALLIRQMKIDEQKNKEEESE